MKKTIVILIILIQCTALYSAHIYVNGEILNFRDYPNGNKIGMLNLGTKLSVLEEKGDWVKVRIEGWVYKPLTSSVKHETVQSINYEIISQYTLSDIKKSYNIRLNNKVSEDVLTKIAYEIKNSDKTNYDRIYICYYLPGWETDSGAWATTHFNPGLEVKILGLEKEETEKLYKNSLGNNVICWGIFEKLGCKIEIINKNGKIVRKDTYSDGSSGTYEMIEKKTKYGRKFVDKNDNSLFGEYYLLNKSGMLEFRDNNGLIDTGQK